jgi:hypothetical protein
MGIAVARSLERRQRRALLKPPPSCATLSHMQIHCICLCRYSSAIESQIFFFRKRIAISASYPVSRFITTQKGTVLSPAIPMTDETKTKLRSPICERPFEAEQKIQIHNCLGLLVRTLGLLCFYIGGVWSIDTLGNRFERVFLRINTHYDPILRKHSHIIKSILDSLSSSYSLNSAIWYSSRERYACSLKNYPNPQALRLQNKMKKTQKVFDEREQKQSSTQHKKREHIIYGRTVEREFGSSSQMTKVR